jgi:hypothetical protein
MTMMMMMMMSAEQSVDAWQGKPKYLEKTYPNAVLSTTNPTEPKPDLNPGRRGGKSASELLSF